MKPFYIVSDDFTAGVICDELRKLNYPGAWGLAPTAEYKYIVVPRAANADRLRTEEIIRAIFNARISDLEQFTTPEFTLYVHTQSKPLDLTKFCAKPL